MQILLEIDLRVWLILLFDYKSLAEEHWLYLVFGKFLGRYLYKLFGLRVIRLVKDELTEKVTVHEHAGGDEFPQLLAHEYGYAVLERLLLILI